MSRKVTVIGAGAVGSTITYTLMNRDTISEIVLIDINKEKAVGEVLDIAQGTCFRDPIKVTAGDYEDAKDSDIVIITSGIRRKPEQTRIEIIQTNLNILKDIAASIVKVAPDALYIIVSNPVDVLTYVFTRICGLPACQVIGSGTVLDSARLQFKLSEHLGVAQKNIDAHVFGEHGDSAFVPWSLANVSGARLDDYLSAMKSQGKDLEPIDQQAMLDYVHKSGGSIIARKGATNYAIAMSVCRICDMLLSDSVSLATVSTMMQGEYGLEDVCLSIPTFIGPRGVEGTLPVKLNEQEMEQLKRSAEALKAVIKEIQC